MHRVRCYLEVRGRFLRPLSQFSRISFLAGVLVKLVGHQGGTQAGRRAELLRRGWRRLCVKDADVVSPSIPPLPHCVIATWLRTEPCSRSEFWSVQTRGQHIMAHRPNLMCHLFFMLGGMGWGFGMVHKLRMFLTFLNGWKKIKRRIFRDVKITWN